MERNMKATKTWDFQALIESNDDDEDFNDDDLSDDCIATLEAVNYRIGLDGARWYPCGKSGIAFDHVDGQIFVEGNNVELNDNDGNHHFEVKM